jgi:Domain of unknown function (DUF3854)
MNRALELLLSRIFEGALALEHQADLSKSGLVAETIRAHYIRSVPRSMLRRLLGFDVPALRSAMLLPFRSPSGGFMDHVRVRIFPTLTDRDGHTMKYLGPRGAGPRLYFCVPSMATVIGGDEPIWLVEGVKKALAVAQLGLPAVGFEGIEAWHVRGSRDLLPDFDAIPLRGRLVELVPDADWQTNPAVERGIRRLGVALCQRGARPRLVTLPAELAA